MADQTKFLQMQKTTLSGSGCTSSATSITLSSFKLPDGTTNIAMTDIGDKGFATIEPGTSREESITFTGVTQNGDGSATITGVTRGCRFVSPYDEVSANKKSHAGGAIFVITNTAGFYDQVSSKDNDETITGTWTFSTTPKISNAPLANEDAANKAYIDGISIAGSPNSSTTVKGIGKVSTAPASATEPIFVGDNDPRVPSQDENNALAGTSGSPSATNKYVTAEDVTEAKTASKIPRRDANSDILVATTPTAGDAACSKTYTDKMTVRHKTGVLSVNNNEASITTTLTCGFQPKVVRMYATGSGNSFWTSSWGTWNATDGNASAYHLTGGSGTSTTYIFYINDDNNAYYIRGLVNNITATTFDLVITSNDTNNISGVLVWEAEGQE